jgi:putative component of membrane protein insertase Oxa1/YidC/SpoIIIJ protein YidD
MKYLLLLFSLLILDNECQGQNEIDEIQLLKDQNFVEKKFDRRKVTYLFASNRNVLVKYNPISLTFGGLLFFYQKAISPQISVDCPYEINCSNFSKRCIQHFGLLKGISLTADRLTRCSQFTLIDLKQIDFSSKKKIIDPIEIYETRKSKHK